MRIFISVANLTNQARGGETYLDELIGQVFENNAGQKYIVLKISGKNKSGNYKYKIRFLETGYEREVEKIEIKRGKIKDKLARSVFRVGYLGNVKMVEHKREYNVWSGMLERCYCPKSYAYNSYGGKGVKVCDRWLSFENFLNDIKLIDGYDEELFNKGLLYLDKDIKQQNKDISQKIYSLETCRFVTFEENNNHRNYESRKKKFIAIAPDGTQYSVTGIKEFARKHNLAHQSIIRCLNGEQKSHKGWRFYMDKEVK
jgi:hypothetical protein